LQADKEFVLAACRHNGWAVEYASAELQTDKEVVLVAASSYYPDAFKYAKGGMRQHKDCLVAAKVWDSSYEPSRPSVSTIVLSTRFSLDANSKSQATRFAVMLKENEYIRNGQFSVYSPNAFGKDPCDPEWKDVSWPCRGTFDTRRKEEASKKEVRNPNRLMLALVAAGARVLQARVNVAQTSYGIPAALIFSQQSCASEE
jgi:hypothetical protein